MKNYHKSVEINKNPNWLYIPNHPYRYLIIGGSGSCKTNVIINVLKSTTRHLFVSQRCICVKVSITYQWKTKSIDSS